MTTIATANIFAGLPRKVAELALDKVLTETRPHIVGVQEWGTARNPAMRRLAHKHGMEWTRVPGAGPVMWDKRLNLVRAEPRRLARAGFMGRLAGRSPTLPDSIAALVILEHNGREAAVLNVHLTAEVQYGADYRRDPAHRARVRRHRREVRSIANIARRQRRKGRDVYVVGDFNYAGLVIPGLTSCWLGRDGGTLGNRAVDIVFATSPAVRVRTIATASDHDAVAATY